MKLFGSSFGRVAKNKQFDYKSRFYDQDRERFDHKPVGRMNFRSGSKILKGRVSSQDDSEDQTWSERTGSKKQRGRLKLVLLLSIFAVLFVYYQFDLNGIIALVLVFLLLILFIRENNRG